MSSWNGNDYGYELEIDFTIEIITAAGEIPSNFFTFLTFTIS